MLLGEVDDERSAISTGNLFIREETFTFRRNNCVLDSHS